MQQMTFQRLMLTVYCVGKLWAATVYCVALCACTLCLWLYVNSLEMAVQSAWDMSQYSTDQTDR